MMLLITEFMEAIYYLLLPREPQQQKQETLCSLYNCQTILASHLDKDCDRYFRTDKQLIVIQLTMFM